MMAIEIMGIILSSALALGFLLGFFSSDDNPNTFENFQIQYSKHRLEAMPYELDMMKEKTKQMKITNEGLVIKNEELSIRNNPIKFSEWDDLDGSDLDQYGNPIG